MFAKSPAVTALVVAALAIGIGANSALFTVIHNVLLSPLPFPDAEEIVVVNCQIRGMEAGVSGPDYLDWKEQNQVFKQLCAIEASVKLNLTGTDEPISLQGWRVTGNFYELFGIQPFLGRGFFPDEFTSGTDRVAILGHRLWKNQFGANRDLVGQEIILDGATFTVIGVAPAHLGFVEEMAQLMVPLPEDRLALAQRGTQTLMAIGRLKSGVTLQLAQADMDAITHRLAQEYVSSNKDKTAEIIPLHEVVVEDTRALFWALYGAVCFVLLIACVNVANLLLARSGTRSKEIAVRCALGASRFQIIRQLLTESVLLALAGGGVGLVLAIWGLDKLTLIIPPEIPVYHVIHISTTVLGFTLLLSVLAGLLFGMAPAWHAAKTSLDETLKESSRASTGGAFRHRILNSLVVGELALALVLLAGAGLFIKSVYHTRNSDHGFNTDHLVTVDLELPAKPQYKENGQRVAFYAEVLNNIQSLPGVESVAGISHHPTYGSFQNGFSIEGQPLPTGVRHFGDFRQITHDYFNTMGIPLLKGRYPSENDGRSGPFVAIVNEAFVRKYFPDENPIGQRLKIDKAVYQEIIGVVGNVKSSGQNLNVTPYPPKIYEPIHQLCRSYMSLMVRTQGDPASLSKAIQEAIWRVDPNQPITSIITLDEAIRDSLSIQRFCVFLLSMMAGVALLLAVIGIYGVMAYSVSQRTHEIGIRMALGARADDVINLVMRKGLLLTGIGVGAGLIVSLALSRFLTALLFEISSTDPLTFLLVSGLLFAVSLLASFLPARKASQIEPMVILHNE